MQVGPVMTCLEETDPPTVSLLIISVKEGQEGISSSLSFDYFGLQLFSRELLMGSFSFPRCVTGLKSTYRVYKRMILNKQIKREGKFILSVRLNTS